MRAHSVRRFARVVLSLCIAATLVVAMVGTAIATRGRALSDSPDPLVLGPVTNIGAGCNAGGCSFGMMTITNGNGPTQTLVDATLTQGWIWITWAGTCNDTYQKVLPRNTSCTVQFGYQPLAAGIAASAHGTFDFASGVHLDFYVDGVAS